jgi:hypothetical protein
MFERVLGTTAAHHVDQMLTRCLTRPPAGTSLPCLQLLPAQQVLHSRCFFEPTSQRHLAGEALMNSSQHAGSRVYAGQ